MGGLWVDNRRQGEGGSFIEGLFYRSESERVSSGGEAPIAAPWNSEAVFFKDNRQPDIAAGGLGMRPPDVEHSNEETLFALHR